MSIQYLPSMELVPYSGYYRSSSRKNTDGSEAWGVLGTSTYAGGVSDSIYGATAYAYMDTNPEVNTGAKKSWYFFDNEVVCLGAGIQSTSTYPVHTTVNQCFLKDGILVDKGGKEETLANGSYTLQAPQWVLHDKIGYFFPQKRRKCS